MLQEVLFKACRSDLTEAISRFNSCMSPLILDLKTFSSKGAGTDWGAARAKATAGVPGEVVGGLMAEISRLGWMPRAGEDGLDIDKAAGAGSWQAERDEGTHGMGPGA